MSDKQFSFSARIVSAEETVKRTEVIKEEYYNHGSHNRIFFMLIVYRSLMFFLYTPDLQTTMFYRTGVYILSSLFGRPLQQRFTAVSVLPAP